LVPLCDESEREDLNSFRVIFEVLAPSNDTTNYFDNGSIQFEEARKLYVNLKGSHQLARVKALRHKHISHSAIQNHEIQLPKYEHLYELLSSCISIVTLLAKSVISQKTDYDGEKKFWDNCSTSFFNNLIKGQLSARNN
jgi:hypothetical protein